MHRKTNVKCAIKMISKESIKKQKIMINLMMNELKVLETVSHPNVLNIYELLHDDNYYFIVSEYMKYGELYDFIVERGSISEIEVKQIVRQLFLAVNYLHQHNLVHRDIKPENILISNKSPMEIKITDFGFATFTQHNTQLTEVLGSPIYMPPEIVKGEQYDNRVDVWSAGVVTYVLITGKPPFYGKTKE